MKKRILALLLVFVLLFTLGACGGSDDKAKTNDKNGSSHKKGELGNPLVFTTEDSEIDYFGEIKNKIDLQTIYDKIDYIPEMLYGKYGLESYNNRQPEVIEKFKKDMDYKELDIGGRLGGSPKNVSTLPCSFTSGKSATNHTIAYIPGYHWMQVEYYLDDGNTIDLWAAYSIDGNKIKLNFLKEYEYIKEKNIAKYELSNVIREYTFKFEGTKITLSADGKSVTLTADEILEINDWGLSLDANLVEGEKALDNIEKFDLSNYINDDGEEASYGSIWFKPEEDDEFYGDNTDNVYAELTHDGLFTITYQREADYDDETEYPVVTHQFACFLTGDGTFILADGKNVYNYSYTGMKTTADGVSGEEADFSGLTEEEIAKINAKKENLLEDLAKAFNDNGIKVTVDAKTGEIAMDSSVLFGGDSSVLSSAGKTFLNKFISVYSSIVYSDKYNGFIAKTLVEGHTAPVAGSTYESGLPLSEARAKVVKDYCLSDSTGIDAKYKTNLNTDLKDVGYSNSKPISDKKGNIDMAASRRVSFRFIVNVEK